MNLTLSVDDKLVEKARQVAARQGTSLQALVRQFLETLAGSREGAALVDRLEENWREADDYFRQHPTKGYRFDRDDLYEDRVGRRRGR
jgi:antitoxin component of RelBE/YafQ-DinJ toxin-antitoxin module